MIQKKKKKKKKKMWIGDEICFFFESDIHMFTNNIYNIKTIKVKET